MINEQTKEPLHPNSSHYDIIILGAGPAGATCALQLRHSNLKVLLIDKATFPRSKTCGDAITGRSIKTLYRCCPELVEQFRTFPQKIEIQHTRLNINHRKPIDIHWVNEAYCCRRADFDHAMLQGVRQYAPNVHILEGFQVDEIVQGDTVPGRYIVGNSGQQRYFSTQFLVGSDGTQSIVSKKLTSTRLEQNHHAGAVRAYFSGVNGLHLNRTEVFVLPEFMPGYFWVFPLSEDTANVGFGMLTHSIARQKVNLKDSFYAFIQASPELKARFGESIQVGKLKGFGLALGSRRVLMSGEHFLLTGDAASLIDPASGEGISNAIVSGKVAAETILAAFEAQDFSADFVKSYERKLFKIIGKELSVSTILLRSFLLAPRLLDAGAYLMANPFFKRLAKKLM
ncbi:NAD(P)/FAD-dependent oxidoreductase [Haliscomenobacter hydrossis]|uniref:Geranylgeranyl reductase n=1 Tax=Haliscomenobacter hydrossis (strain ATCC 27775 / DSM 1100 / LMG 10767 / O) TaxID=760192 RepID=F4L4T0_HALH1|nr:geranylgeranyl reductase family protein [Haliscomenobacter hydrossis]AEE53028.1 geranylgeranyl reductase [Haliscomenobacter hydrossis DSM 1100]